LEDILNKKTVFFSLWWLLAVPLIASCLLTAANAFMTLNYEYLPAETDFLSDFFYDASYIVLDAALCICIGAFCFALYKRKAFFALVCALVTIFNAAIAPMAMFFVRSIFLASVSGTDVMEKYFSVDVYVSVANTLKMLAAIIIALIVFVICLIFKFKKPLAKPFFAPKSEPVISALACAVVNLVYSTFSFTFSGDYDFISLAVMLVFAVASYFIMAGGVYFANKKCGN
jgi:hypothetical protein